MNIIIRTIESTIIRSPRSQIMATQSMLDVVGLVGSQLFSRAIPTWTAQIYPCTWVFSDDKSEVEMSSENPWIAILQYYGTGSACSHCGVPILSARIVGDAHPLAGWKDRDLGSIHAHCMHYYRPGWVTALFDNMPLLDVLFEGERAQVARDSESIDGDRQYKPVTEQGRLYKILRYGNATQIKDLLD